jgi:hypothetical protein
LIIAAQFLEYAPHGITPAVARARLRQVFEELPISLLMLGWNLPERLEAAVAEECASHATRLFRWQPLLASDAGFALPQDWLAVNLVGEPVRGFQDLPEFSILCPNRSAVQEWIAERLEVVLARGVYQGVFLDRMRWPSPAEDPGIRLACFCEQCRRLAADSGLDLERVRASLDGLLADPLRLAGALLTRVDSSDEPARSWLRFRADSITRAVGRAVRQVGDAGLSIGLDCFSPALTHMVGQDLTALAGLPGWIKIMTYPRALGPAGLPYELLGLARWMIRSGAGAGEALQTLARLTGLPFPANELELARGGFESGTLRVEIDRGRAAGVRQLFAGLALVELQGVNESSAEQIERDLAACESADGIVLSWDLWHIPGDRLRRVRSALLPAG